MHDNERGYHHLHKVDKGIQHIDHPARSHNDIPEPGICGAPLNADPHGGGFKMPVGVVPNAARPANDMGPPVHPGGAINPDPHPYNPSSSVKLANTYARPTWERKLSNE